VWGCSVVLLQLLFFVQVVLESLPVSSSGHLALVTCLFNRAGLPAAAARFAALGAKWNALLHLPTLVILGVYFLPQYLPVLWRLLRRRSGWWLIARVIILVALADVITAALYLPLMPIFTKVVLLWVGFGWTTMVLLSLCYCPATREGTRLNLPNALLLGVIHGLLGAPGMSRLATMYASARWLGFRGRRAFELAWLVQVPLIIAATARDVYREGVGTFVAPLADPLVVVSLLAATVLGYLALCVSGRLARSNQLWRFAYCTAVLTVISLVLSR